MKAISFLLLLTSISFGCSLKANTQYLSLSGPISMLLAELNLLKDTSLKGVSSFHKVKTSAPRIEGGVFISKKYLKGLNNAVVFYDESTSLEKTLLDVESVVSKRIDTKHGDTYLVFEQSVNTLKSYLSGCKEKLSIIGSKVKKWKNEIAQGEKFKDTLLFYLGELEKKRRPQLVMSNDLFVKKWKKLGLLNSYPSEAAYVAWSSKILKTLGNTIEFGLNEAVGEKVKKIAQNKFNIYFPGVLTPGFSQIKFMHLFPSLLKRATDD